MATKKKASFEEQLAELEGIIENLENGGSSLDESIKHYEAGMALVASLEKELGDAEQKVTVLRQHADGTETEEPLPEILE